MLAIAASRMSGAASELMFQLAGGLLLAALGSYYLWQMWVVVDHSARKVEDDLRPKTNVDRRYLRAAAIALVIVAIPVLLYVRHLIADRRHPDVIHVDKTASPEEFQKLLARVMQEALDRQVKEGSQNLQLPTLQFDAGEKRKPGSE
jgi:ABC-type nickel/cobalt efflux system permease component RcnA